MTSSWMHPDENLSRPSDDEVRSSLQQLELRPVAVTTDPARRLVDAYRSAFSGHAHLAAFDVVGADPTAAWFLSREEHEQYPLADQLLRSAGFAAALPEVVPVRLLRPPGFRALSPLMLEGSLASVLSEGGPRPRATSSGAEAKALAASFCTEVFGDRYDEVRVEHSVAAWSTWFRGVAWDHTWVVVDRRHRRVTVLCVTDGD